MSVIATQLIAGLVDSPHGLAEFIRLGLSAELFRGPEETSCYEILHTYAAKYGQIPPRARFEEQGFNLPLNHPDPVDYYHDQLKTRYVHLMLKQTVIDVSECLNADAVHKAQDVMTEAVMKLTKSQHKKKLVNFATEGKEIIQAELTAKKLQGEDYGIKFGWPTLDNMADGLIGGDLITIVGRPGQGKTYAMLYTASHAWMKQGRTIMFVSMEMKPLPIMQRLAALNAKKSITQLKKAELSSKAEAELMAQLETYKSKENFWVVDGRLATTVGEIVLLARQLKPDVVWIDGGYLVKSLNNRLQRHERVTEVCEGVKGDLAEALDIPAVLSFQFNRQQKKGDKGNIDNIAYSDSVGQISSVVLGLGLSDDEESVESIHKRQVDVIKGRNGEVGSFDINWRFDHGPNYMDFSEIKVLTQEDMQWGVG